MMCSLSGGLASMGAAVPYAIAAKFAHPDRPVIALVGDGAMQMNNMAELITRRAVGDGDGLAQAGVGAELSRHARDSVDGVRGADRVT